MLQFKTGDAIEFVPLKLLRASYAPLALGGIVAFFLLLISAVAAQASGQTVVAARTDEPSLAPARHGGPPMVFSILRNGAELGRHEVRFNRDGDRLNVELEGEVVYKLGTLVLYRYSARRAETWIDDKLVAFRAWTNDDGKITEVLGRREGDMFHVNGPAGAIVVPGDTIPDNFWNIATLQAPRLLDVETGRPMPVTITGGEFESVAVDGGEVKARRYRLNGKTEKRDVWYDETGRWVRMEMMAPDMSKIEFVLK